MSLKDKVRGSLALTPSTPLHNVPPSPMSPPFSVTPSPSPHSQSITSPPPAPSTPSSMGGLNFAIGSMSTNLQSVLTHEDSDPMFSSAADSIDDIITGTNTVQLTVDSQGTQAIKIIPSTTTTVIQQNPKDIQLPFSVNNHALVTTLPLLTSTASPSFITNNSSLAVQVVPDHPPVTPQIQKHSKMNLLGCFATSLAIPSTINSENADDSKPYVVNVFDQGCFFTPGTDTHPDVLEHLRTVRRTEFSVVWSKRNPSRVTYDEVAIDFGPHVTPAPKPGTSQSVIVKVANSESFFMQKTATHKVELYFLKTYGRIWIGPSVLITNVNSPVATLNEDFVLFATKKSSSPSTIISSSGGGLTQIRLPTQPLPHSETLHLSSGTITLHASSEATTPTTSISANRSSSSSSSSSSNNNNNPQIFELMSQKSDKSNNGNNNIAQPIPPSPVAQAVQSHSSYQIVSQQYRSLSPEQVFHCTFCTVCKKRFRYVMDHLFHFTMSAPCRASIFNNNYNSNTDNDVKNNSGEKSFYNAFANIISSRCKMAGNQTLICDLCNVGLAGPVQYGMHRDQHRPAQGDLFLCQFCSKLFRTPYNFIRHDCIKLWNVVKTIEHFSKMPTHGDEQSSSSSDNSDSSSGNNSNEDAFKIYSQLTAEERDVLLKCPACQKQHSYMSGLVSHFRSSNACLASVIQTNQSKKDDDEVDLTGVVFFTEASGMLPRSISCEICGIVSKNQLGYAIHRDHHSLRKQGMLICKGCNNEYRAPCEFYRHNCNSKAGSSLARLYWCPFCDVSRHCDIARETAKLRAKTQLASNTSSSTTTITINVTSPSNVPKPSTVIMSPGSSSNSSLLNGVKSSPVKNGTPTTPNKRRGRPLTKTTPTTSVTSSVSPVESSKRAKTNDKKSKSSESFVCADCSPYKILKGSESVARHCSENKDHTNINPLWVYNQVHVNLVDLNEKTENKNESKKS